LRLHNHAIDAAGIESIFLGGDADTTPPSPDPMTWYAEPAAVDQDEITMTATEAIDVSGVEYYFECTAGGGHDSGWQSGRTYVDSGLTPDTEYTYRVKARDKSLNANETAPSVERSATTMLEQWPYGGTARVIPGTIEAEDFDNGGQDYAYWDTSPEASGSPYRPDEAVEIETNDTAYAVMMSWASSPTNKAEWMEYTIDVPDGGYYNLKARTMCYIAGRGLKVYVDGGQIASFAIPVGSGTYTEVDAGTVQIAAGANRILKVQIWDYAGGAYLDRMSFTQLTPCEAAKAQPGYTPLTGDLNEDCYVDLIDLAALTAGWPVPYDMDDYAGLAGNWMKNNALE
jgi:hypothetical protein